MPAKKKKRSYVKKLDDKPIPAKTKRPPKGKGRGKEKITKVRGGRGYKGPKKIPWVSINGECRPDPQYTECESNDYFNTPPGEGERFVAGPGFCIPEDEMPDPRPRSVMPMETASGDFSGQPRKKKATEDYIERKAQWSGEDETGVEIKEIRNGGSWLPNGLRDLGRHIYVDDEERLLWEEILKGELKIEYQSKEQRLWSKTKKQKDSGSQKRKRNKKAHNAQRKS